MGGFLFAFSPWHTARAFDQVSLTAVYILPLFLLALIAFTKRRDLLSTVGLAAVCVLAVWTDFHFGLFCSLIAGAWIAVNLYLSYRRRGRSGAAPGGRATARRTVLLALLVIVVTVAAAAPILMQIRYKDPALLTGDTDRETKDAVDYSANPWNYVVPPSYSLAWRGFTDSFVRSHLGKRTTNEVTSYPGMVTVILAIVALFFLVRSGRRENQFEDDGPPRDSGSGQPDVAENLLNPPLRTAIYFSIVLMVTAFILSLPPYYEIGSVLIPTPSILVSGLVPFFRYFCRWSLVVTFGLCLLAGIGFSLLSSRRGWSQPRRWVACLVVLLLFAIDVTIIPPFRTKDIHRPPVVLEKLEGYPHHEPVAIYPLAQGREYATLHYYYYQQFHLHPMLNGVKPGTEADLYRLALKDIYSPYTPRMLSALSIDKVIVLDSYFANKEYGNYPYGIPFDPDRMPPGYLLEEKTDDGYIYQVVAEPAAVFPLYYTNFTPPSILGDGNAWVAMVRPSGDILLVSNGGGDTYSLTVTVANPGDPGTLTFKLDGQPLGKVSLGSGVVRVTSPLFKLGDERNVLTLHWDGEPVAIDGKPFRKTGELGVYLLLSNPEISGS